MNTTELKALAEKATPGPWHIRTNRHPNTDGTPWGWLDLYEAGSMRQASPEGIQVTWSKGRTSENNARYVAAANPAAILELISAHEDAQGEIRELRDRLVKVEAEHEALKKAISDAEPVAWRDPTNSDPGQAVTFSNSKAAKWPHIYSQPIYTLEGIRTTPAPAQRECWCEKCDLAQGNPFGRTRMSLCPECGDKRCPRAKHHDNACARTSARTAARP